MEHHDRAGAEFRHFVSREPASVSAYGALSSSLLHSGHREDAVEVTGRLIDIDPDHHHACSVRGAALLRLGRSATGAFDQLLRFDEHEALLSAASQVREAGDHAPARRYLSRVADLVPEELVWVERARLAIDEGDLDAALETACRIETLPGGCSREVCCVPGRLQAAVRCSKTGDKRCLLALPLEQRQLPEGFALPPSGIPLRKPAIAPHPANGTRPAAPSEGADVQVNGGGRTWSGFRAPGAGCADGQATSRFSTPTGAPVFRFFTPRPLPASFRYTPG